MNLSSVQVFLEEVLCSLLFVGGEGVYLAYLRREGLVEVDLMVVGMRRGDIVSGFFREDLGKVSIFWWECNFGFRLFSSDGEFGGGG